MLFIVKAEFIKDYSIRIVFNNGISDVIDFKPILEKDNRQIVTQLLDKDLFNRFKVDIDTICWENGVDFAPEYLYEIVQKARRVA